MCGTLKYNDQSMKIGTRLHAHEYKTGRKVAGEWTGFIKEEKLNWWKRQAKLIPIEVRATSFIEGKFELDVPSHSVLAYQLMGDVKFNGHIIGKSGEIKLLTRKSINRFETSIHSRWPVVKVGPSRKLFIFQPWDVRAVTKPVQLSLDLNQNAAE